MKNFTDLKFSTFRIDEMINKEGSFDSDIGFEYKLNENFSMTSKGLSLSKSADSANYRIKFYSPDLNKSGINSMSFSVNKKHANLSLGEIVHGFGKLDFDFVIGLNSFNLPGSSIAGSETLIMNKVRVEDLSYKKTNKGISLGVNLFYNYALRDLYHDTETYKKIGFKEYIDRVDFSETDLSADNHLIIGKYSKRRDINNTIQKFAVDYYNFPLPLDIDIPVYLFCSEGEFALKIPNLLGYCNDYLNDNGVQAPMFLRSQLDFARENLVKIVGTENKAANMKDFIGSMLEFTKEKVKIHEANEQLMG